MGSVLTHGLITRRTSLFNLLTKKNLNPSSTITMKVTNNKSSHNNNKRHFNFFLHLFFFFLLLNTVMPTGIIYSATPTPLSALGREVWRGQWGRLLDSEVRRWRGVLWPFVQPLWRLLSPPFRMSWMCCTIKLMATAGDKGEMVRRLKVYSTDLALY